MKLIDVIAPVCPHCDQRQLGRDDRCRRCWRLKSIDPEEYEKWAKVAE